MAGQVAYHLMAQAGMARAPWAVTTIVSCLPVLVLSMGTALAHMLRADAGTAAGPPAGRQRAAGSAAQLAAQSFPSHLTAGPAAGQTPRPARHASSSSSRITRRGPLTATILAGTA
jgi:hypothetical protein